MTAEERHLWWNVKLTRPRYMAVLCWSSGLQPWGALPAADAAMHDWADLLAAVRSAGMCCSWGTGGSTCCAHHAPKTSEFPCGASVLRRCLHAG